MKLCYRRYLKEFMDIRIEEILRSYSKKNKKYRKLISKAGDIAHALMEKIGEDTSLVLEYEETLTAINVLCVDRIYFQGLIDGVRLGDIGRRMLCGSKRVC